MMGKNSSGEWDPGAFLGLESPLCDAETAQFVVLPVPYEKTTTYKKGTARGPEAILQASRQVEFYDQDYDIEARLSGIHTLPPVSGEYAPDKLADRLEDHVGELLGAEKTPVVLGGEHSISLGPIRALHKKYPDLSILHFDAHGDLRDEYEGTKYGHGCIMRRVAELKIPIVQIGIRSLCVEEMDFIRKSEGLVRTFFMKEVRSLGNRLPDQAAGLLSRHVFVSFDLDGLDPSVIPATGTPEPGGLSWYQALDVIEAAGREKTIVGADVVELLPLANQHASDFAAARLTYKIMGIISKTRNFSPIR